MKRGGFHHAREGGALAAILLGLLVLAVVYLLIATPERDERLFIPAGRESEVGALLGPYSRGTLIEDRFRVESIGIDHFVIRITLSDTRLAAAGKPVLVLQDAGQVAVRTPENRRAKRSACRRRRASTKLSGLNHRPETWSAANPGRRWIRRYGA